MVLKLPYNGVHPIKAHLNVVAPERSSKKGLHRAYTMPQLTWSSETSRDPSFSTSTSAGRPANKKSGHEIRRFCEQPCGACTAVLSGRPETQVRTAALSGDNKGLTPDTASALSQEALDEGLVADGIALIINNKLHDPAAAGCRASNLLQYFAGGFNVWQLSRATGSPHEETDIISKDILCCRKYTCSQSSGCWARPNCHAGR